MNELCSQSNIPVYVMLRPHNRMSYTHSNTDMKIVLSDMSAFIEHGADGFVFGALLDDRSIDTVNCRLVIDNAKGRPVTFHRAFDMTVFADMIPNLSVLSNLGFGRVLTSGFAETAELGVVTLKQLCDVVKHLKKDIIVMPGCGITPKNAHFILLNTNCRELHGSAKRRVIENISEHQSDTPAIKAAIQTNGSNFTCVDTVTELVKIVTLFE